VYVKTTKPANHIIMYQFNIKMSELYILCIRDTVQFFEINGVQRRVQNDVTELN